MTKLSLIIHILFLSFWSYSQKVDVLTQIVGYPTRMINNGNDLYYSLNDIGEIHKIDITTDPPLPIVVATGLSEPASMAIKGSDLYIAQFGAGKISKIDLSSSTTQVEDVLTGIMNPNGLIMHNDTMYFSESYASTVSKFDMTSDLPVPVQVVGNLDFPSTLAIRGNELFITESLGNKISKIALASTTQVATNVLTGLNRPVGIRMNGDTLYVAELFFDNVFKFDVTQNNSEQINISATFNNPADVIVFNNSDLYFLENSFAVGKISKIENALVGITELTSENISVFPIPTTDLIHFVNLKEATSYKIFRLDGGKCVEGVVRPNGNINLSLFPSGKYVLQLKTGFSQLILKE